jgi:hypothetical protein
VAGSSANRSAIHSDLSSIVLRNVYLFHYQVFYFIFLVFSRYLSTLYFLPSSLLPASQPAVPDCCPRPPPSSGANCPKPRTSDLASVSDGGATRAGAEGAFPPSDFCNALGDALLNNKIRHIFAISDGDSVDGHLDQRQSHRDSGFFDPLGQFRDTFFPREIQTGSHLDSVRVSVAESASVNSMDKSDGGNAP